MFTTIFCNLGRRMGFVMPSRLRSAGTMAFTYRSLNRFIARDLRLHWTVGGLAAAPAQPLARLAFHRERHLGRLVAFRADVHDFADRHRQFFLEDAALRILSCGLRMPLDDVDAFDFD